MGKSKDLATRVGIDDNADTTAITIDSSENVGIGTSSPNRLLSLSATQPVFQITNTASGNTQGTIQYQVSGSTQFNLDNQGSGSGGAISFMQAGAERMKIDTSGRVTMPSQPYGEAEGLVGSSTSVSSGSIINWLTANHLNGGVTFSNNGRFTVPTAGRYLVHYRLYFYPNSPVSQYYQISVQKNGSEEDFMIDEEVMTTYSGSGKLDRGLSFTTVIRLAASDYLELKYHGSATANFYRGGPHNRFKVLLLS